MKMGYLGKKLKAAMDSIKSRVNGSTATSSSHEMNKEIEVKLVTIDPAKESTESNETNNTSKIHKRSDSSKKVVRQSKASKIVTTKKNVHKSNASLKTTNNNQNIKASPTNHDGIDLSVYSQGVSNKPKPIKVPHQLRPYELKLSRTSQLLWSPGEPIAPSQFLRLTESGKSTQPLDKSDTEEGRELMLGIDFGTSSTKVVIGDSALDKAFAVPFFDAVGIERFLLPSRIFQSNSEFSLLSGASLYRDLKLALISSPINKDCQYRFVAFLAYTIQHARAWLLDENGLIYKNVNIFWKMAVGLPAETHHNSSFKNLFEHLCRVAWIVAAAAIKITKQDIDDGFTRALQLKQEGSMPTQDEDIEISIIPEISAQIYGYVASDSFDKKAPNDFLLVDVGAGTVDTSLFHVKKGRVKKWDFEFYTSSVQPFGSMNFNRYRLEWWLKELKDSTHADLIKHIISIKEATDSQRALPKNINEYISFCTLKFNDETTNPDKVFFQNNLIRQIKGETFWRAWKEGHLRKEDLCQIPTFLCGGGMRLPFYKQLEKALQHQPNCSWMTMKIRYINMPKNLRADTLPPKDYDRLSVAYGLSFLDVGSVIKNLPKPSKRIEDSEQSWIDNYIDKDKV